jgi:hypothetical protein
MTEKESEYLKTSSAISLSGGCPLLGSEFRWDRNDSFGDLTMSETVTERERGPVGGRDIYS